MWQAIGNPLVTSTLGAIFGAAFVHFFAIRRDIAIKRREIILPNLLAALNAIEDANSLKPNHDIKRLEDAVTLVQRFGDIEMVRLSNELVAAITTTGKSNTEALYFGLRDKIRSELGLKRLPKEYMALNITLLNTDNHKTVLSQPMRAVKLEGKGEK